MLTFPLSIDCTSGCIGRVREQLIRRRVFRRSSRPERYDCGAIVDYRETRSADSTSCEREKHAFIGRQVGGKGEEQTWMREPQIQARVSRETCHKLLHLIRKFLRAHIQFTL